MTTKQIAALVGAAIDLDATIAELTEELAGLKQQLIVEARRELDHIPHEPDYVGCSQVFKDDFGQVAKIVFPIHSLIRGFWLSKDCAWRRKEKEVLQIGDLEGMAGKHFSKLFLTTYKPNKNLRELAPLHLGPTHGPRLIELLTEPSSPRVSFETKGEA